MKIFRLRFVIGSLAVALAFVTNAKPLDERDLASKIVGIWMVHADEYGPLLKGGLQIYRADKTFTDNGAIGSGSRNLDVQVDGKWWLEGDVLYEEVTKSSLPELVPIGRRFHDTIVAISEEEMLYRDEDGKDHLLTRFKK
ncbi:MAG TPA: hypothetical protein VG103_02510 [Chthoniobacterales bacterium]|nr:hypothetical protein [Chthoniobacterales bacterium]